MRRYLIAERHADTIRRLIDQSSREPNKSRHRTGHSLAGSMLAPKFGRRRNRLRSSLGGGGAGERLDGNRAALRLYIQTLHYCVACVTLYDIYNLVDSLWLLLMN